MSHTIFKNFTPDRFSCPSIKTRLSELGVSERKWLEFGKIWRYYGQKEVLFRLFIPKLDKELKIKTSERKQDQFIAVTDLPKLVQDIGRIMELGTAGKLFCDKGVIITYPLGISNAWISTGFQISNNFWVPYSKK